MFTFLLLIHLQYQQQQYCQDLFYVTIFQLQIGFLASILNNFQNNVIILTEEPTNFFYSTK